MIFSQFNLRCLLILVMGWTVDTRAATVFEADFQGSILQANTTVTNLDTGTEIGSWAAANPPNINVYADSTGVQKALCPDSNGNGGYSLAANFSGPVLLSSNVTIRLLLARGRVSSPGTGKEFTLTGYDGAGNASFDLKVFANENQAAGTNGALYWNNGTIYTNWFGTNFSNAGDIRNFTVSSNGYATNSMSALQIVLQPNGYVVSLDSSNVGTFNWVSSVLPYNGSPVSLSQISIVGGSGAGDWFDNFVVTGVQTGVLTNGFVSVAPESRAQLITDWGFDIKGTSGYNLTPAYAQTLYVTNHMTMLRVPIHGETNNPAHPAAGVIIGSYYADELYAMTNARAADSNVVFFASKKLAGQGSFPAWTKNASGVIPYQYALMLADYLEFMYTNGFTINVLGIDNERMYNEGNITPATYEGVITNLQALSESRGFPMPGRLIAPENYSPDYNWLETLTDSGWGGTVNIVGTHYYPESRPLAALQTLVGAGGARPDWQSEVHWDNSSGDVIDNGERTLATLFDCTDTGLSGYVWWAYTHSGVQGGIEEAFTVSTIQSHPVATTGTSGDITTPGLLFSRAFRSGTNLVVWVVNNSTSTYSGCQISTSQGSFLGTPLCTQWNLDATNIISTELQSTTNFAFDLPPATISEITVNYQSPVTNSGPQLAAVPNRILTAGQNLTIINVVTESNVPPGQFTWSIMAPVAGLAIDTNGVVRWRPTIAESPGAYVLTETVSDNETPNLSATQQFTVTVLLPSNPSFSSPVFSAGQLQTQIAGSAGPDYVLQGSTNLSGWTTLLTTNPAALPFTLTLPDSTLAPQQFFRIVLGP
jgi:O-glycosyl hydrolase